MSSCIEKYSIHDMKNRFLHALTLALWYILTRIRSEKYEWIYQGCRS